MATERPAEQDRESTEFRQGMRIEWDVPLVMNDGVVLRADVFRPPHDHHDCPVILSYGPYAKGLAFQEGYPDHWQILADRFPDALQGSSNAFQNWEVVDPEKWVPDGYACVRVDSRGAGRSPGYLDPWSPREAQDLYACVEWAADQPWSNRRVGLNGISYYAMNQWTVASLEPPHLAAICVWEGAADFYRDTTYHGGIMCINWRNWYEMQVKSVQHGVGVRGPTNPNTGELACGPETLTDEELEVNRTDFAADIRAHRFADGYHRDRTPIWSRVRVPLLSASNWGGQALHSRGNFEGFIRAGSAQKWLEVHGDEHWTRFYAPSGVTVQKRFFDCFLKGQANGWSRQPRVQLQVRRVDGSHLERDEREWPLARTEWARYYLDSRESALGPDPVRRRSSVSYDALGDGVDFVASPFEYETEFTGPVMAKIFLSSSSTDADVFLTLRLFDPTGKEVVFQGSNDPGTTVTKGWLRASHRKLDPKLTEVYRPYHTHDKEQPLTPGEVYELDVELWPTCVVVPAGYWLGLTIQGRDFERSTGARLANFTVQLSGSGPYLHNDRADRPVDVFGGVNTVHTGGEISAYLLLPMIIGPA